MVHVSKSQRTCAADSPGERPSSRSPPPWCLPRVGPTRRNSTNVTSPTAVRHRQQHALVIARGMDINSLDPSLAYCDTCQIYMTAVYETLIGLDSSDNQTLVPRLATSWEGNAEQTEFTFTLDPDAQFADGSKVTSADVKFSWERLKGLQGSASYRRQHRRNRRHRSGRGQGHQRRQLHLPGEARISASSTRCDGQRRNTRPCRQGRDLVPRHPGGSGAFTEGLQRRQRARLIRNDAYRARPLRSS